MEHLCVCWFRAAVVLAEGHTKGSQDPRDSSSYTLSQVSPSTSKTSWKGRWKKKGVEGDPSSLLLLCVAATVYAPIDVALFFSDCRWLDGDEEKHLTSVIYTRYSTYIEKDIPQMLFIQEEDSAAVVLECFLHLAYAWIIPVLVDSICHVDNSWVSLQCVHIAQENIVTFHICHYTFDGVSALQCWCASLIVIWLVNYWWYRRNAVPFSLVSPSHTPLHLSNWIDSFLSFLFWKIELLTAVFF